MGSIDVPALVGASSIAELCWSGPGGPAVRGVVPLVRGERPVVAFLYADHEVAREVAASSQVALVLAEPRSTSPAFRPTVLHGRPRLLEDPEGEAWVADLAVQELRRFPPSRVLADSPLLMREHWWYLPRLLVELDVEAAAPADPRRAPYDHLLVVDGGDSFAVRAASRPSPADGTESAPVHVAGSAPPAGRALLFGQDATFPDLEQWVQWRWRGDWDGEGLTVHEAPADVGLGRPPGLLQRWRRQRDLERRCKAAIPRPHDA